MMTAEQFLAPHEYHAQLMPRIVRADEHRVWWNGRKRRAMIAIIEWPFAGRTLHVRFEGDATSFALTTTRPDNWPVFDFEPSRGNLKRRLDGAIRRARLWRRFAFESGDPAVNCAAFVRNGGVCQWVASDATPARQRYRTVEQPQRFLIESADIAGEAPLDLRAKIAASLKDSDSDAVYALAVVRRNADEPTPWKRAVREGYAPMQAVWCLICRAQGADLESGSSLRACGFAVDNWKNGRAETFPATPQLRLWGQALLHFAPDSPRQTLPLQRLCVRDAIGSININFGCYAREFSSLSFHQQLEARLELRAWAATHLPADVARELEH